MKKLKEELIMKLLSYFKETWMRHINDPDVSIDISSLNDLKYDLKDYQKSHVSEYFNSKNKLQLRGCILNFDPGMGKTFTAIALSLIIKKQTIIFCPNSLISVWYDEIRNLIKKKLVYVLWLNLNMIKM